MIQCKKYHLATSIEDALRILANSPEPTRPIAGGTDLLLDMQQGRHPPVHTLIDITEIPQMKRLEIRQDRLFIGASVTHNTIASSALIQQNARALSEASAMIGGPQVRNVATLGGNVAHALPAADGTIALMALAAQAEIASMQGKRLVPLMDLFAGPGVSTIDFTSELLTGFYLPLGIPHQSSAFCRIMRPQGVAIAILNCAIWLERDTETIKDVRIAIGPSGPTPRRMQMAEVFLRGKTPDPNNLQRAHELILEEASFRTSKYRATKEYRQQMAGVLLNQALVEAWKRTYL
jgi:carbon-monoxide dehydrogenase medium subunit